MKRTLQLLFSISLLFVFFISNAQPPNDDCENAETVFVASIEEANNGMLKAMGTTIAAEYDGLLFPKCLDNLLGGAFVDVWYKFDPEGFEAIELRFNSLTENASFYFDIWENCDSLAVAPLMEGCFDIDEATTPNFVDTILNIPISQNEYHIRITTRISTDFPGDFSFQLVGGLTIPIKEIAFSKFQFFPNPVTDMAHLNFELPNTKNIQIEVLDILGQQVHLENKGNLIAGKHHFSFNLNDFPSGIYFLSIRSEDQVKSIQFVKE